MDVVDRHRPDMMGALGFDVSGTRPQKRPIPRVALLGCVSVLVPLVAGQFAHAADVARGRRLAQILCSQCHFITTNQPGWFDAPSFVALANNPATTPTSLVVMI